MDNHVTLPISVIEALRETFVAADTDGRGFIDCKSVVNLIRRVLGSAIANSDRERLLGKAELLAKRGVLNVNDYIEIMSDTLTETTQWGYLKTDIWGYVGIDTLQEQIRKKALKQGFEFNLLVVGRSGLGKSTLLNTLFKSYVSRKSCTKDEKNQESKIQQTTEIKSITHLLEEKGVRLRLTLTDTPGFGDQINNENCWLPIQEYISEQYEKYLIEEQCITRKRNITDSRVHCCLYFIPPSGHSLTPLDIEFMKRLDKIVNIVPVIAKADTLTIEERLAYKHMIRRTLEENGIAFYPMKYLEEDPDEIVINNKIRDMIPFAVVGSDKQYEVNGKMVYGRKTQWGIIEVENRHHCEFSDMRDMLIRTHMQDLIDITKLVHYEKFRRERLSARQSLHINGRIEENDVHQLNREGNRSSVYGTKPMSRPPPPPPPNHPVLYPNNHISSKSSNHINSVTSSHKNSIFNNHNDDAPNQDSATNEEQPIDIDNLNESSL